VADRLALALVVALVSALSIVLGELVPKSLALRSSDRFALLAAPVLLLLSRVAAPVVAVLTAASNLFLRPFHDRTTFVESRLSLEELRQLMEEAADAGSVDAQAGEIATRAIDLGDLPVGSVMVPRVDELGSVAGLVSVEDLAEEVLGEIFAEHETPTGVLQPDGPQTYLALGTAPVHEINRELGTDLPVGPGFSTIAGLLLHRERAIPITGARIALSGGVEVEVVEASSQRIRRVRLRLPRKAVSAMRGPPEPQGRHPTTNDP
jgi:CBS domain containing-hemolysin-like protein